MLLHGSLGCISVHKPRRNPSEEPESFKVGAFSSCPDIESKAEDGRVTFKGLND